MTTGRLATLLEGAGRAFLNLEVQKSLNIKCGDKSAEKLENLVNIVRSNASTTDLCKKK